MRLAPVHRNPKRFNGRATPVPAGPKARRTKVRPEPDLAPASAVQAGQARVLGSPQTRARPLASHRKGRSNLTVGGTRCERVCEPRLPDKTTRGALRAECPCVTPKALAD